MSQVLYQYRPAGDDDERRVWRWFERDTAPAALEVDGANYELVVNPPRDQRRVVKCIREKIVSIQAPKWWPYAKRHDEQGRCVFESEEEYKEAIRRAQGAGEQVSWDN